MKTNISSLEMRAGEIALEASFLLFFIGITIFGWAWDTLHVSAFVCSGVMLWIIFKYEVNNFAGLFYQGSKWEARMRKLLAPYLCYPAIREVLELPLEFVPQIDWGPPPKDRTAEVIGFACYAGIGAIGVFTAILVLIGIIGIYTGWYTYPPGYTAAASDGTEIPTLLGAFVLTITRYNFWRYPH